MSAAPPPIRNFAGRLIALEAARAGPPVADGREAARVCEKLGVPLARLAGIDGFRSLLSRAAAMAKSDLPAPPAVRVGADGALEGLDGNGEAGLAVVAHLLGLLVTFIGEPLALRLVRDTWPESTVPGPGTGSGDGT